MYFSVFFDKKNHKLLITSDLIFYNFKKDCQIPSAALSQEK